MESERREKFNDFQPPECPEADPYYTLSRKIRFWRRMIFVLMAAIIVMLTLILILE